MARKSLTLGSVGKSPTLMSKSETKNKKEKRKRKMKNYRHYGQAQEELSTVFSGYNRADTAFVHTDEVVRRFQKVQKIYANEVATLKAMREMIDNILEIIEEEGKEVK